MPRNRWPDQIGMGGRIKSESLAGCPRNAQTTFEAVVSVIPCEMVVKVTAGQCLNICQALCVTISVIKILLRKAGVCVQRRNHSSRRCLEVDRVKARPTEKGVEATVAA